MNKYVQLFFENNLLIYIKHHYYYHNDGVLYKLNNDDHLMLINIVDSVKYEHYNNLYCNHGELDITNYDYLDLKKNIINNSNSDHPINYHFIIYYNKYYYAKDNNLINLSDYNILLYLKTNLFFNVDERTFNKFMILQNVNIYSYYNFLEKYIFYKSDSNIIDLNLNRYLNFFAFLTDKEIKMSEIKSLIFKKNRANYPIYQYENFKFSFWILDDDIILLPQTILIGYFRKYKYTFDLQLIIYYLIRTNINSIILDDNVNYNLLYLTNNFDQELLRKKIVNYDDINVQQKLYQTYILNYNNMSLYNNPITNIECQKITKIDDDICICLHIGNIYLLYDMYRYMSRINTNFVLYITIKKILELSYLFNQFMDQIKNLTSKIIILNIENYGADIYPFLYTLKYFSENNIIHKYLLKLHTKSDNVWRHNMIEPLVNKSIDNIIDLIEKNGIYGFEYFKYDYLNHDYLIQILNKLGFFIFEDQYNTSENIFIVEKKILQKRTYNNTNRCKLNTLFDFVPGTIFWTKFDLIMSEPAIYDLCYDSKVKFKKDYLFQQIPHAIERLFGIYRYNYLQTK
jgi:hypothetical protein